MSVYSRIVELLKKQGNIFAEVEDITNKIVYEQIDNLPSLLEQRGELLEKSVLIKEEIDKVATNEPGVEDVLRCNCDIWDLSDEETMVFEAIMRVRATVNRISKMDSEVYFRIEKEKSSILEHIKQLNNSGNSVAENYKRAVQTGFPKTRFDGGNKIKI